MRFKYWLNQDRTMISPTKSTRSVNLLLPNIESCCWFQMSLHQAVQPLPPLPPPPSPSLPISPPLSSLLSLTYCTRINKIILKAHLYIISSEAASTIKCSSSKIHKPFHTKQDLWDKVQRILVNHYKSQLHMPGSRVVLFTMLKATRAGCIL